MASCRNANVGLPPPVSCTTGVFFNFCKILIALLIKDLVANKDDKAALQL